MTFFIIYFVKSPRDLKYFISAFILACMKIGQEGLVGKITGGLVWQNQGVMRLHGSTPLYGHPNSLSGNAVGTLPFIYYLFPIGPWFVKLALLIQLVFACNIILFTGSRTGYVAFMFFVAFVILKSKKKMKTFILGAIILLTIVLTIPQQYSERFESIFTHQEKEGSSSAARIEILKDAWHIFLDHPLGVGVGAFPAVRMATFGRFQDTHNLYLEVATNLGIQGVIVFFLFVYELLKTLKQLQNNIQMQIQSINNMKLERHFSEDMKSFVSNHTNDLNLMMLTCQAVFLFILMRLALGIFGMDLYEIYWWFAAGAAISIYNMNKYAQKITDEILEQSTA